MPAQRFASDEDAWLAALASAWSRLVALDSFVQLALPVAVAFCSILAVLGLRGVLVLELLIAQDAR